MIERHRWLVGALTLGTLLRVIAMLGYPPALWFNDSYDYVQIALKPFPHPIRPDGYGIFLWLLKPFHSFGLVVAVQHLLGLATGVLIYLLLIRRRLPGWGAALAAAPVLLDGSVIELETLILSDTLFLFLVVAALTVLLWQDEPSMGMLLGSGALLAAATLTRTIGLPIALLVLLWLLLRRRWQPLALVAVTALLPLVAYAGWFHTANDRYAITATDGVFLWGRTAAFVHCDKIPADLKHLCPPGEPGERKASSSQVWAPESPLRWTYGQAFDPKTNEDAQRFAIAAIKAQPLDYLKTVSYDFFIRTFAWNRSTYPTRVTAQKYVFPKRTEPFPTWPVLGGGTPATVTAAYDASPQTKIVEPFAATMRGYQQVVTIRGPILAGVLLLPLFLAYRRRQIDGLLPWTVAISLLAVPPLTVDFDTRYALTAMPIAALAAGIAFTRRTPSKPAQEDLAASTAL